MMKSLLRGASSVALAAAVAAAPLAVDQAQAAAPTVTMVAPVNQCQSQILGASGTVYTPSTNCQISVANSQDVIGFIGAGWMTVPAGATPGGLSLVEGKNSNGSVLVASSAASGNFLIAVTAGTSEQLTGESATGATKTDTVAWEYKVPNTYVAGAPLTFTVYGNYACTGTAGTKTINAHAYLGNTAGTQGSDLIGVSAVTDTTSNAGYAFTIPGSTLAAGARMWLTIVAVMQETGGSSPCNQVVTGATVG